MFPVKYTCIHTIHTNYINKYIYPDVIMNTGFINYSKMLMA